MPQASKRTIETPELNGLGNVGRGDMSLAGEIGDRSADLQYPVATSSAQIPALRGIAELGATGIDEHCVITTMHDSGAIGIVTAGIRTQTCGELSIYGTDGRIRTTNAFNSVTLTQNGKEDEILTFDMTHRRAPMLLEAKRCLAEGLKESPLMPLDHSLTIAQIMNSARDQWGLRYPGE